MRERKRTIGVIAVVALVIASGCLTVSVQSNVNGDGTIAKYQIRMEMPTMVLQQMQQSAQQNGTTLQQSIESGYNEDNYNSINVEVTEDEENNVGVIEITLRGFDPAEVSGSDFQVGTTEGGGGGMPADERDNGPQVNVTVEENRIVYTDDSFYSPGGGDGGDGGDDGGMGQQSFELSYTLKMPGEITESNADNVDGKTAYWNRSGADVLSNTEIRAVSKKPAGGGVLGLPGFGAGLALVALVLVAGLLVAARGRDRD